MNETDDQLALELTTGNPLTASGSVNVTWQRVSDNSPTFSVEISEDGNTWTFVDDYTNNKPQYTWTTLSIPLSINTKYIRFTSENGRDLDIDAISYFTPCGPVCIPPSTFTVTGSGNYCTGGAGLPVALSGSETGVEYQLFNGIAPLGALVTGTGGHQLWQPDNCRNLYCRCQKDSRCMSGTNEWSCRNNHWYNSFHTLSYHRFYFTMHWYRTDL